MKYVLFLVFAFAVFFCSQFYAHAQSPQPAQAVAAPAGQAELPKLTVHVEPALQVKDDSLVPPTWLQDLIVSIKSLPYIGPVAVKVFQWIGVIASILTALCAFLLVVLKAMSSVLSLAQLTDLAAKIAAFQNSKIMYWLKYLSLFNAQKKEEKKS